MNFHEFICYLKCELTFALFRIFIKTDIMCVYKLKYFKKILIVFFFYNKLFVINSLACI